MFDALNDAVTELFGDLVIWRRGGMDDATVSATVDIEQLDEAGPGGGAVAGARNEAWTLTLPSASLPDFDWKAHRFVVKGRQVKAATEPFTDVTGMMIIRLEWTK